MSLPELYAAQPYGWGVVYAVTIEGIPTVWSERVSGLTLPGAGPFAAYSSEDGALVIDDSGPVGSSIDRASGIGVGLSLGFALLDTSAVRSALLAPTHTARLTSALSASATTIAVDSTTGWPATGALWLGVERVTYTGTTPTTFTGVTRAAKPYAHTPGSASGIVTDAPRWWIGREVTLWALAVDPGGYVPGSQWGDIGNVLCIWRGYIEEGPQRIAGGFRFEASALDRRLDRALQAEASGKVIDTEARYVIDPATTHGMTIQRFTGGALSWTEAYSVQPYAALLAGTAYTGAELRAAVVSRLTAAIPGGGHVQAWEWIADAAGYRLQVTIDPQASGDEIRIYPTGSQPQVVHTVIQAQQLPGVDIVIPLPWVTWSAPDEPKAQSGGGIYGLTVDLDEGAPASVSAPVTLEIEGIGTLTAQLAAVTAGRLYVGKFSAADLTDTQSSPIGRDARVRYSVAGALGDVVLRHLHSSGTTALRDPTFDTLPRAQGYGLTTDRVNQDSFALLGDGWLSAWQAEVETGARSVAEIFGGVLALSGLALVSRPDVGDSYRQIKIACVRTSLGGSGGAVSITSADLLALTESPVEVLPRARPQNLIRLQLTNDSEITYTDQAAADVYGTVEQSWSIPSADRDGLYASATPAVAAYLAAQPSIQTMAIRVSQQIDAYPGDVVDLDITHPAIYDWQTGQSGYAGSAVVLGREVDLRSGAVRLTVAASASVVSRALAPAMVITAYSAGSHLEVDRGWFGHFSETYERDGSFDVVLYTPGNVEDVANAASISGVSDTGTACRLAISLIIGALTPVPGTTYATIPEYGASTGYQEKFAHTDDGGAWI